MDPKVRTEAFKIGFATVLLLWLARHLGGAVWWLVRQPALWVAAVSWYVAWRLWTGSGPLVLVGVAVVLVLSLIAWRVTSPARSGRRWRGRCGRGGDASPSTGPTGNPS